MSDTVTGASERIIGKYQICLIVKEFVDTGERIEIQPIADYQESCWGWEEAKDSLNFFIKRVEERLNGGK